MTQRDKILALARYHGGTPSNITDNAYLISIYSNCDTLLQMVIDINQNPELTSSIKVNFLKFTVKVDNWIGCKTLLRFSFDNKETLVTALQDAIFEAIQAN